MIQNPNFAKQDNLFIVAGELTFSTVMSLWESSLPLLSKSSDLHFDLSQVNVCNSAGVALILEWIKYAKQRNIPIEFHHIPTQLTSIIAVSGLKAIFKPLLS